MAIRPSGSHFSPQQSGVGLKTFDQLFAQASMEAFIKQITTTIACFRYLFLFGANLSQFEAFTHWFLGFSSPLELMGSFELFFFKSIFGLQPSHQFSVQTTGAWCMVVAVAEAVAAFIININRTLCFSPQPLRVYVYTVHGTRSSLNGMTLTNGRTYHRGVIIGRRSAVR